LLPKIRAQLAAASSSVTCCGRRPDPLPLI
jgi:hypothetical protein